MTKTKSTKRAFLSAVLALIVCVSMLIGTTFAWFTDNVSSTNNIIKSGNLDVELEYYDGDSWEKVTATTNVFEQNTLWEPGHTEVVYLKISNLGTLALKYQLGINIVNEIESISVEGNVLRLSNYIEFGAIDGVETPYADRAAARAAVTESKKLSTGHTKTGNIEADADAEYVALVVYMPENIGNEANYRTGEVVPQIDLGINLMATQYTSEEDSFNDQYDADAKFGGVPAARVTVLSDMPTVNTLGGNTVTLDTAYVFNTTETYDEAQLNAHRYWHADFVATLDKDVDGADMGLAGQYDTWSEDWVAFTLDGMTINAGESVRMLKTVDISMNYEELCNLVKEFSCGAFAVDQAAMKGTTMTVELRLYETTKDPNATSGDANVETGKYITIGTYSYTFGAKKVADAASLKDAIAKGGEIALVDDIALDDDDVITVSNDVTLDLGDNTLTLTQEVRKDGAKAVSAFKIAAGATLTVEGGEFVANFAQNGTSYSDGNFASTIFDNHGTLIIEGGTFKATQSEGFNMIPTIIDNSGSVIINGGYFVTECTNLFRNFVGNPSMTINGGTFVGAAPTRSAKYPCSVIWNQSATAFTVNGGDFTNLQYEEETGNSTITIAEGINLTKYTAPSNN